MAKAQLDKQRLDQQMQIEQGRLGARISETNTQQELEDRRIASKEQLDGLKIGVEIAKDLMND